MKKFAAYWSPDFCNPGMQIVDETNFTEDAGYDADEIAEIKGLAIGQEWRSHDYGFSHMVLRVE